MSGLPTILLGTTKGAFILEDADGSGRPALRGPFCDGWPINHVLGDPRTGRIWAAGGTAWHGTGGRGRLDQAVPSGSWLADRCCSIASWWRSTASRPASTSRLRMAARMGS